MIDPELFDKILEFEELLLSEKENLASCTDEENRGIIEKDISMHENAIKHIKMDLTDEQIAEYTEYARSEGIELPVFPYIEYTEEDEKSYREFLEWFNCEDEVFEDLMKYIDEHSGDGEE